MNTNARIFREHEQKPRLAECFVFFLSQTGIIPAVLGILQRR